MKKIMTGWLVAMTLTLLGLSLPAQAQQELVVGSDYAVIEPALSTDNPAKIEVIEFFSYACPHCADLNPHIGKWAAKRPSDVVFTRIAVPGNRQYSTMSKLYYALESIGELQRLDSAVFNAIHEKRLNLIEDKSLLEWVTSQGVDAKKFSDAYSSFGVSSKVSRASQLAAGAKISGVPALIVGGRYLVVGRNIKSHDDLLALTDRIIDKVRTERGQKKK